MVRVTADPEVAAAVVGPGAEESPWPYSIPAVAQELRDRRDGVRPLVRRPGEVGVGVGHHPDDRAGVQDTVSAHPATVPLRSCGSTR